MTVTFPNRSEGFLLDEDNALRRHLMGLTVSDDAAQDRKVGVWFSHPDTETREQRYPYIIINLIDVTEASNRVHSGEYEPVSVPIDWLEQSMDVVVVPESSTTRGGVYNTAGIWVDTWRDEWATPLRFEGPAPVPVQIDYQVRAFSRHPRHSREIIAGLLGRKLPYRYGVLDMRDIDGSVRRTQLLDIAHAETIEDLKRLFVEVFTVRVDAVMPYSLDDLRVYEDDVVVTDIFLDVFDRVDFDRYRDVPLTSDHLGHGPYDQKAHLRLPQHQPDTRGETQ